MKMSYKTFSILLLSVVLANLAAVALINIVVDPFYIFRTPFLKEQAQINDRYAKLEFLKKEKERFNSYFLGSSRMFLTHPEMIEKYVSEAKFYNLATIFGTMYEHFLHVKYFIQHGYAVKNLYIGLDADMYFTVKIDDDKDLLLKLHPEVTNKNLTDFYWSYLSSLPKGDLRRKLRVNFGKKVGYKYEIEKDGGLTMGSETAENQFFSETPILFDRLRIKNGRLRTNLEALRELVALCGEHHINLILFITPYHQDLMDRFVEEDYLTFLRDLSEITAFWDFSGYNSITTDNKNYLDRSHYKPSVSRLIAARIFNDKTVTVPKDFGVWVAGKNIDSYLENVKRSFKNKTLQPSS
jgi:hypothetical protein